MRNGRSRRGRCVAGGAFAASIAAALVAVPSAGADNVPSPALFKHFKAVSITRDSAGIAHVVARNFVALGYGEGYAFAQDNLCTFANDIVTLEGERSRYFGPNGLAVNYSAGTSSTNLQSDLFWRYVQKTGVVQRELAAKPPNGLLPRVRQMYVGFVAGYNAYLESGRLRDPACKGKPWVRPITLTDMVMRGVQITTEGSSQQFLSGLVQAAPPTVGATAARTRAVTRGFARLKAQFGDTDAGRAGSNGVGLGALDTRSGHGLLLANPHFPWRGTERFWMAQLDVPGQYDVEGGTLMGFPFIGIGFNRNIAWTHTVSTTRRFVAYQLHLVPGDPTSYYLDGKPTKWGTSP